MIGIKPVGNESQWAEKNKIYDEIDLHHGDSLYLHTVDEDKTVESPTNISRYNIVLLTIHGDDQFCINDFIVSLKLAEYDESTRHHLKRFPNLLEGNDSDSSDSDWEKDIDIYDPKNDRPPVRSSGNETECKQEIDFDFENAFVNFEDDDLLELFPGMVKRKTSSTPTGALQRIDEANEIEMDEFEHIESTQSSEKQTDNGYVAAETDGTNASSEHPDVNHQVEYFYKRPKVDWWQTEEQIKLRIGAHDDVQYGLEITSDHLIYE